MTELLSLSKLSIFIYVYTCMHIYIYLTCSLHTGKLICFMVYVWSGWEFCFFLERTKATFHYPKWFACKFKWMLPKVCLLFETELDVLWRANVSPLGDSPWCFMDGIAQVDDLACSWKRTLKLQLPCSLTEQKSSFSWNTHMFSVFQVLLITIQLFVDEMQGLDRRELRRAID